MKFQWIITNEDITLINKFVNNHKENNFVKNRIQRNLVDNPIPFSKEEFWKSMLACLLTTQQRSWPNSKISKFINTTLSKYSININTTLSFLSNLSNFQKKSQTH